MEETKNTNNNYPLILCFYFHEELFRNKEILEMVTSQVTQTLEKRDANAIAYFLRCAEGMHERVECINPILVSEPKMEEINKMIEDIKKQFDIGQGADKNLNDEIEIKKCECNNDEGCIYCNK